MLKWQGLYLHSNMLPNGGGGESEMLALRESPALERSVLLLSLGWHQTNTVI